MRRNISISGIGLLAVGTLLWAPVANAEIRSFQATVESQVQEFSAGTPTDSESAFDSYPESTTTLPMMATVGFSRSDSNNSIIAEGRAVTTFTDPRLSEQPSPEEFGISSLTVSTDALLSHRAHCRTTETRQIVFTTADTSLAAGTAIRVRSRFFLDGIIVLWTSAGVSDLTGTTAQMHVEVAQERPNAAATTVLTADISVTGAPNETGILQTAGSLTNANLVLLDLNGSVSDLNAIQGALIPDIAIPYEYETTVGEAFTLKATIEATTNSVPGGHGAAVVLGAPLVDLATLVNNITGGAVGDLFTSALQNALQNARPTDPLPPAKDIEITALPTNGGILPLPCGALGLETAAMALALGCISLFRGRRW